MAPMTQTQRDTERARNRTQGATFVPFDVRAAQFRRAGYSPSEANRMAQYQASSAGQASAERGELPSPFAAPAGQRGPSSDFQQRERDAGLYLGGNDPMAGRRAPQPTLPQDQQAQGPAPDPLNLPSPAGATAPQDDSVVPDNQPPVPAPTATTYAPGNQRAKPTDKNQTPEVPRSMVEASFDLPDGRQGVIRQGDNVGDTFRRYRGDAPELPPPGEDGMSRHKVHDGETIAEIAQKYDMTSSELIEANNLPADAVAADLVGRDLVLPGGSPQRQGAPLPPAQEPTSQSTDTPRPAQDVATPPVESAATEQQEAVESSPGRRAIDSPNRGLAHVRAAERAAFIEEAGLREAVDELYEIAEKARIPQRNRSRTQEALESQIRDLFKPGVATVGVRTAQNMEEFAQEAQKATEIIRGRIDDLNSQMVSLQRNIMSGMSIRKQADQARIAELADRAKREQQLLDQAEKLLKKFNQ